AIEEILREYQQRQAGEVTADDAASQKDSAPSSGPTCYQDGIHPIGQSIADQFQTITTYDEVMVWFCNGAEFEDILNALTTEEITTIDADAILQMVAADHTWDEIWLELGVTN
ncbi:MAG: hypothetical protein IH612_01750, partial [Desulfofustis sp.]|nr:hypothetical protein [Desulfofustis sp.]